jgi:uncharacterized membrane protein
MTMLTTAATVGVMRMMTEAGDCMHQVAGESWVDRSMPVSMYANRSSLN